MTARTSNHGPTHIEVGKTYSKTSDYHGKWSAKHSKVMAVNHESGLARMDDGTMIPLSELSHWRELKP